MGKVIPVLSVKKALDLLDQIVESDLSGNTAKLAELAQRMSMPSNSVHNLLKTLVACGYVRQSGRGGYAPGYKCRQLGQIGHLQRPASREKMEAALRRFAHDQGEDCVLAILVNGERVVLCYAEATQAVCISPTRMEKVPFYEKPTGRLLAALAGEAEFQQVLARQGLPGPQWENIQDEQTLRERLSALRRCGWCQIEDQPEGLTALACPVNDLEGNAWGVVGTFAPSFRCSKKRSQELRQSLFVLAEELSGLVPQSPFQAF
jgi:IclR family acetate operon transcriptional repressor